MTDTNGSSSLKNSRNQNGAHHKIVVSMDESDSINTENISTTMESDYNRTQQCIECEDQHAELLCQNCEEKFCRPCWDSIHRRGERKTHRTIRIMGNLMPAPKAPVEPSLTTDRQSNGVHMSVSSPNKYDRNCSQTDSSQSNSVGMDSDEDDSSNHTFPGIVDVCRYVPLRLTAEERQLLLILENALNVSEYTDRVDVFSRRSKQKIIESEIESILMTITGLSIAAKVPGAQKLLNPPSIFDNLEFFTRVFEIGRRYKISNPSKMRSTYGKLMFMLQDSAALKSLPNLVEDVKMVTSFLESCGSESLKLLKDTRVILATREVTSRTVGEKNIRDILKLKNEARLGLIQDYQNENLSPAEIELVLDSINDANNYLECNVGPVSDLLQLLMNHFFPDKVEEPFSLQLTQCYDSYRSNKLTRNMNQARPKLNHDHKTQYSFVKQSLKLWMHAMANMYKLWTAADGDLLSGRATYRLCNTGQGLNRVQTCPTVSTEMHKILRTVQTDFGYWVGLSVVHLGDRDVPNALVFIDKYTQIPRILSQIRNTMDALDEEKGLFATESFPGLNEYVKEIWGSMRNLKMTILSDYFKHGFDGDGDDGGSCIDGRLTSTWNWSSRLEKKDYYPIFMLAGFLGFDGDWR